MEQRARLVIEKGYLDQHFPALRWYDPTDSRRTRLEGPVRTNSGRTYRLTILVRPTFPATCPDMLVSDPVPLLSATGKPMTEVSANMHTLAGVDGQTKICHFRPDRWVEANTLYLVAMKGRIWLEAYEAHLRSGRPMDAFLSHMREDWTASPATPPPPDDSEEGVFLRLMRLLIG